MFSRTVSAGAGKSPRPGAPGLSFIGTEMVISGDVTSAAQLHVDGRIDGHVRCTQLCQGEGGTVSGNIHAEEARIAGLVEGTVVARNLTLESSARIRGDITYQTISIAAGAQVDGRLARRESLDPAAEKPPVLIATTVAEGRTRKPEKKSDEDQDFFPLPAPRAAAS